MRQPGDVFDYPYLWGIDEDAGLDNPKDRRTTLAMAQTTIRTSDSVEITHMLLLGITDAPRPGQVTVPAPHMELLRGGLTPNRPAFVVVSEYDYDLTPGSFDYNPNSKTYGRFSAIFLDRIKQQLSREIRKGMARRVDRRSGEPT